MHKKFLVVAGIVIAAFVAGGCVHSKKLQDNITSAGRPMSRAPAEFLLENSMPNINPENTMVFEAEGEKIDCTQLKERTEVFQGRSYVRYNVTATGHLACPQVKAHKTSRVWKVKRPAWDSADEYEFKLFLKGLADSGCNTTDKCLSGPGNILRTEEDMLNTFYTDCADFPYYLRAYFAYKKNLPMSFVLEIAQAPFSDAQIQTIIAERAAAVEHARANEPGDEYAKNAAAEKAGADYDAKTRDLRYSRNGNVPVSRFNIPSRNPIQRDIGVVGARITDIISSGFLRMTSAPEGSPVETDFYSPAIRPQSIKPGTVLYNVSGHVAVVYDVTAKGEVKFIDAHPDNSITRGQFNLDYKVLKAAYGGNFKNFRPIQVVNPTLDSEGVIVAGQIVVAKDSEIPDFSLEQYTGNGVDASGKGIFKLEATDTQPAIDFVEWTKYRLSNGTYRLDPVVEMKKEVENLCSMVKNRIEAMQKGTESGIAFRPHPYTLPQNIWGSSGDWESYSSPGSDIRLRNKMLSIADTAKIWARRVRDKVKNGDRIISYNGVDLKSDLVTAYKSASASCQLSYTNSSGTRTPLTLEKVISRASLLSFDPYNCIELRWGANTPQELATCKDDAEKREWYSYSQFLRNLTEKDNSAVHGYSLDRMKQMHTNRTVDNTDKSSRYNILNKLMAL